MLSEELLVVVLISVLVVVSLPTIAFTTTPLLSELSQVSEIAVLVVLAVLAVLVVLVALAVLAVLIWHFNPFLEPDESGVSVLLISTVLIEPYKDI